MSPGDFVYKEAFSRFIGMGYSDRDAGTVASEAVRKYRRNTRAVDAIEAAIKHGKKVHAKARKA